jgi:hypothetical protein
MTPLSLAAAMQAVTEEVATDLEVTLERHFMAHQFGCLVGRRRHHSSQNSYGASEENAP